MEWVSSCNFPMNGPERLPGVGTRRSRGPCCNRGGRGRQRSERIKETRPGEHTIENGRHDPRGGNPVNLREGDPSNAIANGRADPQRLSDCRERRTQEHRSETRSSFQHVRFLCSPESPTQTDHVHKAGWRENYLKPGPSDLRRIGAGGFVVIGPVSSQDRLLGAPANRRPCLRD